MKHLSSCWSVSHCRHHGIVWIVLLAVWWSWLPATSVAQQPTATLVTVTGTVLVSGQPVTIGTVLQAGDTIQTQAGASVDVELSDGSVIHISENTQVEIAELTRTSTNVRTSHVKLIYGRLRAMLSAGHQAKGSAFTIDTPNAVIGVKFSQPDVEVSYDPAAQETIGLAHTVELLAKNLLTDEEILVPVGSTVIIVGTTIKIVAGIVALVGASEAGTAGAGTAAVATESTGAASTGAAATGSTGTSSAGMGTGTKVALGVGAAAAVGGGVALAVISSAENDAGNDVSFTGTFKQEDLMGLGNFIISVYSFVQNGASVTGTYEIRDGFGDCTVVYTVPLTGTVNEEQLRWSWPFTEECCSCYHIGTCCARIEGGNYSARLFNDGNSLTVSGPPCTLDGYACVGVAANAIRQ